MTKRVDTLYSFLKRSPAQIVARTAATSELSVREASESLLF
jgi:hypothetical protein